MRQNRGKCWSVNSLEGSEWWILGHFPDAEALSIVDAYEGREVDRPLEVTRTYQRVVPSKNCQDSCCDCNGSGHWHHAEGPGPGAFPVTWVEEKEGPGSPLAAEQRHRTDRGGES